MECPICGAAVSDGAVHGDWHVKLRIALGRLAVELPDPSYLALIDVIKEL